MNTYSDIINLIKKLAIIKPEKIVDGNNQFTIELVQYRHGYFYILNRNTIATMQIPILITDEYVSIGNDKKSISMDELINLPDEIDETLFVLTYGRFSEIWLSNPRIKTYLKMLTDLE